MVNDKNTNKCKKSKVIYLKHLKSSCVKRKFSFQKLADRAIHLYLTDEDFRKQINNHNNLDL